MFDFARYQKFGAELKVVDEVGEDDEPTTAAPPAKPKVDKPVTTPTLPQPLPADGAPPPPKLQETRRLSQQSMGTDSRSLVIYHLTFCQLVIDSEPPATALWY